MIEKNIDENDQAEKSSKLVGLNELLGDLKTQINSPKIIMSPPDFRQIKYNCWCCEDSGGPQGHAAVHTRVVPGVVRIVG